MFPELDTLVRYVLDFQVFTKLGTRDYPHPRVAGCPHCKGFYTDITLAGG